MAKPICEENREYSAEFSRMVDKMLSKDADDRFTVAELVAGLERLLVKQGKS
jgi:hypothetical protein